MIIILNEYTDSFDRIVRVKQGKDCYQPACFNGKFVNFGFQIDMRALPPDFLEEAKKISPSELAQNLKKVIYEIENSLCMYGLMRGVFGNFKEYSSKTFLGINFDAALKLWKNYHGKKLVLGAVTPEKFESMLVWEFGIYPKKLGMLSPEELRKRVQLLSGFDDFYGPEQIEQADLEDIVLYIRASYPISWQKQPYHLEIPLLQNPEKLAAIRNQTITFNVDNPEEVNFLLTLQNQNSEIVFDKINGFGFVVNEAEQRHLENLRLLPRVIKNVFYPTIINDTKEGLVMTGLAFPVTRCEDINLNNPLFREFLESKGWNPANPDMRIRIKPAWLHYGGYGHRRGRHDEQEFRRRLKKSLQARGPYVVQPEIPPFVFEVAGIEYAGNDQMFFLYDPFAGEYRFAGGQRISLPLTSDEVQRGRIHGNKQTVKAEIITADENLVVDKQSLNYI